jgi:cytochrome c oxidase subunit 2
MEGLEELHNNILYYLAIIIFAVTWIAVSIVKNYTAKKSLIAHKYLNHGTLVKNISLYNVYVDYNKCKIYYTIFYI